MNKQGLTVIVRVDGAEVIVAQPALCVDKYARLFFRSILGGVATEDGWTIPLRKRSAAELVVRINRFLAEKDWGVERIGIADDAVRHAIEQQNSFERTRQMARRFVDGETTVDVAAVNRVLADAGWDFTSRRLLPHQEQAVLHGLTAINVGNFSVPGAGKTATTLALAAAHVSAGTVDLIVVAGPLASFRPWESETVRCISSLLEPVRIRGSAARRRELYRSIVRRQLLLLSYASVAADKNYLVELFRRFNVMLIADEAHRIKRFRGGIWAPAMLEVARLAKVRVVLSGTPMPQSGRDLYSQMNVIWPDGEITGSRERFSNDVDTAFSRVIERVRPFVSRTPKSALGLPPYRVIRHEVPLRGIQAEIYELIAGGFRRRLEDASTWKDKIEVLRRARPLRLLQAATNPDLLNRRDTYFDVPRVETTPSSLMARLLNYRAIEQPAKSTYALDLVKELSLHDEKVVCWSNFIGNLDSFAAMVRKTLGLRCFQVDGRVATQDHTTAGEVSVADDELAETREQMISGFLRTAGPAVLVANPASCSESISLHSSCRNAIYLDRTYDCALYLQSVDRIHRLGLPPDAIVEVHILLASVNAQPSIDHLVDASLAQKEVTMRTLLEGAELSPLRLATAPGVDAEGTLDDLSALLRYLLGQDG